MKIFKFVFAVLFLVVSISSCKDAIEKNPKYQRPESLQGKVYDVAKSIPELSVFVECIEKTGLNDLINSSGLYTVMAPTNDAFESYFSESTKYNSINDIDSLALKELVEGHILLMPYSKNQLRSLNTDGWIDKDDEDAEYSGYKRETLLRPSNKEIKVREVEGKQPVIDDNGNATRKVYAATNKYAPLFYSEYLSYARLSASDYEFYFDRSFEPTEMFFGRAKLLYSDSDTNNDGEPDDSYPAENGYVYIIDKVVEPMNNAYDALFDQSSNNQYNAFGSLVNEFAQFTYNQEATYSQEGASEGLAVDKLYNLSYPTLAFNLLNEATNVSSKNSIAYHNALFAPSNEAYSKFVTDVLVGDDRYSGIWTVPYIVKRSIVNNHLAQQSPFYPSQAGYNGSFETYSGNRINLDDVDPLEVNFGSNATFVGLNKVLVPRELKSVVAPVVLNEDYQYFLWVLYFTDAFQILNKENINYTLFAIPDNNFAIDSSLFISGTNDPLKEPTFSSRSSKIYNRGDEKFVNLSLRSGSGVSLRSLLYGQVGIGTPFGNCRKEFLRNLNNYYIKIDNETGIVEGGFASTYGYNGDSIVDQYLDKQMTLDLGEYGIAPDNGKTYSIEGWFGYNHSMFSEAAVAFNGNTLFYDLLKKAELFDNEGRFSFLNEGEALTVFVPTDDALNDIQADTLAKNELQELLLSHFVTGVNVFTDQVNKNLTRSKFYTKNGKQLGIRAFSPDEISIMANDGSVFATVEENASYTNKLYLGWDNGDPYDGNPISAKAPSGITVIVHTINKAIQPAFVY